MHIADTVFARRWMRFAALVAAVFGAVTIREGGSVLFGDGARTAGHVVGFVLWFNFLAGFAYVAAGIGLWYRTRWSVWLASALALGTVVIFGAFGIHVATGGAYEVRTVWAMTLRSVIWILIALLAYRLAEHGKAPGAGAIGVGGA